LIIATLPEHLKIYQPFFGKSIRQAIGWV